MAMLVSLILKRRPRQVKVTFRLRGLARPAASAMSQSSFTSALVSSDFLNVLAMVLLLSA